MPQIYKYLSLKFFFGNLLEHLPPHVHVSNGDKQSIFVLIITDGVLVDIQIRKKEGFGHISTKDQAIVKTIIRQYYAKIVEKWFQFFILNAKVKSETIRKIENQAIDTTHLVSHLDELNKKFYPTEKKESKQQKPTNSQKKKQTTKSQKK